MAEHWSGVFPWPSTASGKPWRSPPVVVDPGEPQVGEGQATQPVQRVVGECMRRSARRR